jgi:hypothetical protein
MTSDPTDWHHALARVTGVLVRGEQRVTTHELLTVYLGIPVTDRASRRLRRVIGELGWRGPRRMRWGTRSLNGYWRHSTVGVPEIVSGPAVKQDVLEGSSDGSLALELETATRLGLRKLRQILALPTDPSDGNILRAQTSAAATAVNAQLRADETRMKQAQSSDVMERILEAIARAERQIPGPAQSAKGEDRAAG